MKTTIPHAQTISAKLAMIAASTFADDWRLRKYQRRRVRAYGEINRKVLKDLGARITLVMN
jgi:hypothetical protein